MDYEYISEDLLIELENSPITALTKEEEEYIKLNRTMCDIEKQLTTIINMLCHLTTEIGNIITKLNYIDASVILK